MKIGITCYPTYGGSGVVATELGIQLSQRGHEVHFICYDRPYRLPPFLKNVYYHEVQVSKYPLFEYPPYSLALASKMVEVATHSKLDILHVHYAIPHATSAYLAKQMLGGKIKIITTLHGTDITIVGADPTFRPITKFAMEQSDAVTSVSRYLKDKTYEAIGVDTPIHVIHNFIDPEPGDLECERENFARDDEKLMIHISNFRPVKRIPDVIEVAERVMKQTNARLLMIGDGPDRSKAEDLCRKYDICERVLFLGKQSDVRRLLNIGDAFLFPSESESFGLAALEAMCQGNAVIASNAGGIPEVVVDGENGYLSNIGDVDKMAADTIRLFNDEALLRRFKQSAIQHSHHVFNADRIIPEYIQLYEAVLRA